MDSMDWCGICERPRSAPGAACDGCGLRPVATREGAAAPPAGPAPGAPSPWAAPTGSPPPGTPPGPGPGGGAGPWPGAWGAPPPGAPWGGPGGPPPTSPSTAFPFGPAPVPPPARRRRHLGGIGIAAVVVVVVLAVAAALLAGPAWDALEDAADITMADTEDVDEPHERVSVSTDLGGGAQWTMQKSPRDQSQTTPLPDGGSLTFRTWYTERIDSGEIVGVYDLAGRPFDLDAGLQGGAQAIDATLGPITSTEVAGQPARTATLDVTVEGRHLRGEIAMAATTDTGAVLMMIGDPDRADDVHDQMEILVASFAMG